MVDLTFLQRARALGVELMTERAVIARPGVVSGAVDPATGKRFAATTTTVYTGRCRLKSNRIANPSPNQTAGDFPTTGDATLSIPSGAAVLQGGDIVVVTASEWQPENVGKRFRVTTPHVGSQKTADRWQVEIVTG